MQTHRIYTNKLIQQITLSRLIHNNKYIHNMTPTISNYQILETPVERQLLSYMESDARDLIFSGLTRQACMAKYWFTYYTDLPDNTKLTKAHLDEFMEKVSNGLISYKANNMVFNNHCHVLNGFIYSYLAPKLYSWIDV